MMAIPTHPLNCIEMGWHNKCELGTPFAEANGENITSNTAAGILRRFETWLKRNNVGGEGKENLEVELKVMGQRCIVMRPIDRKVEMISGFPPNWIQRFEVELWWRGEKYENITLDMRVFVWPMKFDKKGKVRG